jgi:cobalt/nickel transport system ATP-binding protein
MLQVNRLSYTYPQGVTALRGIDLSLKGGEILAILGPNGSGKTTLLKQIAGLLTPTGGNISLDGRPLNQYKPGELYSQVGLVFQDPHDQLFCTDVAQEVAFGPVNLGLEPEEIKNRTTLALQQVGLSGYEDKPVHALSFGQKKRLCLAGVLAMRPKLMLLDEPSGGLDPLGESASMRLLKTINKEQGISLLLATHQVDMVPLFADRVCLLNQGRVVAEGQMFQVLSSPTLVRKAGLRLPRVTHLLEVLANRDGLPLSKLPLTIGQARRELLELM